MEIVDKIIAILILDIVQGLDRYYLPKDSSTENVCSVFNSQNDIRNNISKECINKHISEYGRGVRNKRDTSKGLLIPIGTIFKPEDVQVRSAFRWAFQQYQQTLRKKLNYELNQLINITDVSNNFKLASSMCSQMRTGVFLFFGTKSINSLEIIDGYTKRFQMPFISPSLSRVAITTFDTFQISMKPPLTNAIVDVIYYFDWNDVHYLYDSNEGLQRLQQIIAVMQSSKDHVRFMGRMLEDVDHAHEELRALDRVILADEKKIILDLSSFQAYKSVLRQIAEVGMNKHDYYYLLTTQDFSRLDFRRFMHGGVNLTGFDVVDPSNSQYRQFMRNWSQANPDEFTGAGEELMSDAALAVDSVRVIIEAFNNILTRDQSIFKENFRRSIMYNNYTRPGIPCTKLYPNEPQPPPWMHGERILEAMKQVDFQGITGRINFWADGFRSDYSLQVSSVGLNKKPSKIGTWYSNREPYYGYVSLYGDDTEQHTENATDSNVKIIVSILSAPMLMEKSKSEIKDNNLTGNAIYEGYVVDLAALLAKRLEFDYKIKLVPDNKYGRFNNITKEWDGIMKQLVLKKADMAIAPFTITYERETAVDFTKPFMEIGIGILIKKPEIEKPGVFSFMKPFNYMIWIFIIVSYASVSIGLFLVSRFSPYEWKKPKDEKEPQLNEDFSMLNSFWFSTGALMLQGSDACPRSISGRVIGTVWWFFVLITISSYTANLAAFLTIENMVTPIESADDLATQTEIKYGFVESGTTREFFENSPVPTYRTMASFVLSNPQYMVNTTEQGIQRVRDSKGKYAFLLESARIDYENSREPCDTFKVGRNLNNKGFGIATPKKSPLRDELNLQVLELTEDGTLIKLRNKWWKDRSQCAEDSGKDSSRKRSLSLSNVAGVFYILISGLVMAVIFGALSFIVLKVRLIPVTNYAKRLADNSLLDIPQKGNGIVTDYAINNGHSYANTSDRDVNTYTYLPPPTIGFEAFQQRSEHSDV